MSNNLSNSNTIMAGIKEVGHKVFGGYAELLRIPHTARYSIGSVIACMPFPMVGMTITISVQHYYGNYSLAGMLTAIQAIALAVATPLLGKLTDKFGQRQVSIPTILVWIVAAVALTTSITNRAPEWVLYCLTPFLAAIPPWGAMSRARWTKILKGDQSVPTVRSPVRRAGRMHVGNRQSTGFHTGRDLRSAGILVHRHVRGGGRADVLDRADH